MAACAITAAVESPTPGRSLSDLLSARWRSSSSDRGAIGLDRLAERLDAVGAGARAFEEEGDPAERLDRRDRGRQRLDQKHAGQSVSPR
jgi:hypothetical protein